MFLFFAVRNVWHDGKYGIFGLLAKLTNRKIGMGSAK